jgi:repressor LexA
MAQILYRKQKQILLFLKQYMQSTGTAPTLREIADAMGVKSLATVHEHLQSLEKKGMIRRKFRDVKALEILDTEVNAFVESFEAPILGYIAAGSPIEPFTDPNATMAIPTQFVTGKNKTYVLQVRGESMIEDGIFDGDHVIIEQADHANNGDIVVALLDNGMATLKRFFKEATRIRLEPANAKMQPLFVRNVRVQGKVVGLVRRYFKN